MKVKLFLFILAAVVFIMTGCKVPGEMVDVQGGDEVRVSPEMAKDILILGTEIRQGKTFYNGGKYTIVSVSRTGAPFGKYTFRTDGYTGNKISLYRNGIYVKQINYLWRTTVTDKPAGYYTFNFPGYMQITIRATRGSLNLYGTPAIFNGANYVNISKYVIGTQIKAGAQFYDNKYTVVSVRRTNAPIGFYTFSTAQAMGNRAYLYKDGDFVQEISYNWRTTVTDDPAGYYTFDFPGYMQITIRATQGSLNLYGLPGMFNGANYVNIRFIPIPFNRE